MCVREICITCFITEIVVGKGKWGERGEGDGVGRGKGEGEASVRINDQYSNLEIPAPPIGADRYIVI